MNTHDSNQTGKGARDASGASDDVRQAFASLPFDEKISTLIKVEMDIAGEIAQAVASAVSRAAEDMAQAFNRQASACADEPGAADRPASS